MAAEFPGKWTPTQGICIITTNFELAGVRKAAGSFFVEDKVIPFQAPCASVIYQGQIHIAQSNPDKPAKWYFINVDECILSAKETESFTADISAPPYWMTPHCRGPRYPDTRSDGGGMNCRPKGPAAANAQSGW